MLRTEVIRKRLAKLEECLTALRALQRYDLTSFLANPERYGSAERFLQLSIEAVNDVAAHIVAEQNLGVVEAARDLPRLLEAGDHISTDLAQRWTRMIGFRNILVHDYLDIDREIVHRVLQHDLEDLENLAAAFAKFL